MIIFNGLSSLVHMNQNWIWSHSLYHSRPSPTPNSCPLLFLDEHPSAGPWTAFHHVHMITEEHSSLFSLWNTLSTPSKVCEKRDKSAQANRMQITQTSNLKNYITKSKHSTVHYYHVFVPWREFASSYLSMRIQRKIQNKNLQGSLCVSLKRKETLLWLRGRALNMLTKCLTFDSHLLRQFWRAVPWMSGGSGLLNSHRLPCPHLCYEMKVKFFSHLHCSSSPLSAVSLGIYPDSNMGVHR